MLNCSQRWLGTFLSYFLFFVKLIFSVCRLFHWKQTFFWFCLFLPFVHLNMVMLVFTAANSRCSALTGLQTLDRLRCLLPLEKLFFHTKPLPGAKGCWKIFPLLTKCCHLVKRLTGRGCRLCFCQTLLNSQACRTIRTTATAFRTLSRQTATRTGWETPATAALTYQTPTR